MHNPQFPPLARPTHTSYGPFEDDPEGGLDDQSDAIGTTVLGETINRQDSSADSLYIFDPHCRQVDRRAGTFWQFYDIKPGEDWSSRFTDPMLVEIVSLYAAGPTATRLINARSAFQFVAAPGTDREARVRVKRTGTIQRLCRTAPGRWLGEDTPFSLAVDTAGIPGILHRIAYQGTITWTDDAGEPTGKESPARFALLTDEALQFAADLFYALNALDAERLALYGRAFGICCACGRRLNDLESIGRGIGPDCARRFGAEVGE